MAEGKPVLEGVSLAAIVKDEMVNPAGGIVDFVESTVPYVERAVIVDTGSTDGTREKLEELQLRHSNLSVADRPFDNYSSSRNFSLGLVETPKALVLDADERFTREDFSKISLAMESIGDENSSYTFNCIRVHPSGVISEETLFHDLRLFEAKEYEFSGDLWEHAVRKECIEQQGNTIGLNIEIKHFVPNSKLRSKKHEEWYSSFNESKYSPEIPSSPVDCLSHSLWSQPHPVEIRNTYR